MGITSRRFHKCPGKLFAVNVVIPITAMQAATRLLRGSLARRFSTAERRMTWEVISPPIHIDYPHAGTKKRAETASIKGIDVI